MENWQQRIIFGSLAAAIGLIALLTAHVPYLQWLFLGFIVIVITTASWELLQLIIKVGATPLTTLTLSCTATYLVAVFIAAQYPHPYTYLPACILLLTLFAVFLHHFYYHDHPISTIANSLFPVAFLAMPLGTAISIAYFFPTESHHNGCWWLLFLGLVTKMNDIAAYVVGKAVGKHPLTRYISPKKTWEGAIAGLIIAPLIGLFFAPVLYLPVLHACLLAIVLALAAQFGDLSESLLKRDAGTKDSSTLPGLGGILDVVDAFIFSCPLVYLFLNFYFKEAIS